MPLQTWLADELRRAGLKVTEVDGWKTRGSKNPDGTYKRFEPIGLQWHATAGSRTSTAAGEVNVLLNGSTSAPPPIAQLMIYRDGTIYVVAAGRCNHNLVGWAGPNKGLGNGDLLGIEMANDNRGEPWPLAQLVAARLATAVIMRHIGADPLRRLSGHYEHQPAPPPPGETSTKTDPLGVRMTDERPRVAALMQDLGEGDMTVTDADLLKIRTNVALGVYDALWSAAKGVDVGNPVRVDWETVGKPIRDNLRTIVGVDERMGDVVRRYDDAGDWVPETDPNPRMTVASAVEYLGVTAQRIKVAVEQLGNRIDPAVVIAGVLAGLGPSADPAQFAAAVVAALPVLPSGQADQAKAFADELAARLAA